MRKVAVYVEGQTEYIFVREFLQKWYQYDPTQLSFNCNRLRSDKSFNVPFQFTGTLDCENYFDITDVGNDCSVIGKILRNEKFLEASGFELVIGLRDMYSKDYRKANVNSSSINPKLNEKFIAGASEALQLKKTDLRIRPHFAIMEVEAWILAMLEDFPSDQDPETQLYHPAEELKRICIKNGSDYDKHENEVCALMDRLEKKHFEHLLYSGRCASFRSFVETITGKI